MSRLVFLVLTVSEYPQPDTACQARMSEFRTAREGGRRFAGQFGGAGTRKLTFPQEVHCGEALR
jgi:hypothetical protein